ncbi:MULTISPECIES: hypothetical protein [Streptomyces]|jgi:hypothetical protein|uniref:Integral membrane protein n=1 Tax=Streptomyces hydrogenans TaxID=1873719 RepID=A0ABQ3PNY7_9ACTN|nr:MULTISPECIES: hypothetical protein [Streptomyces]MCM1949785.1 hypothetical protein [Streptomyces sp. G2]GHG30436.1 hypothetical protein GCM10018784_49620 [Streptomyces hydrogenans]GHI26724.1 hypothetical protein Shyd_80950 [Streptomyces hydrogenans]
MSQALLAGLARTTRPQSMVRRFLALDAVVTGANGLAYALASGPLGELLGVDSALLLGLGLFLTAFAAGVGWLASRPQPPALAVKLVVDANLLWAVLSLVALAAWLDPTTAGLVWTPMQAGTVAGFAVLQWSALRAAGR